MIIIIYDNIFYYYRPRTSKSIFRVFLKSSGYVDWLVCLIPNFCSVIIVYLSLGKN